MKRRDFIKQSAKLTGTALVASQIPGCLNYDDLFYPGMSNGKTWNNYQSTSLSAGDPCVIKEDSVYKMWMTQGTNITYCTSSDGITWSTPKTVLGTNNLLGYDSNLVYTPSVIKDGSIYKMWYSGNNGVNVRILYCDSGDGISWSNFKLAVDFGSQGVYDPNYAFNPCVIKEGSVYKMWYAGVNTTPTPNEYRIIYCESSDGITWSNFKLAIDLGSQGVYDTVICSTPNVIKESGIYKMWYGADNTDFTNTLVLYCESYDGINWMNFYSQPSVPYNAVGSGDIYGQHVMNDYGVGKIWFASGGTIYYAESY